MGSQQSIDVGIESDDRIGGDDVLGHVAKGDQGEDEHRGQDRQR